MATARKPLLIFPREVPLVVTDETVVVMRHGVRRIAVHQIAFLCFGDGLLEVDGKQLGSAQSPCRRCEEVVPPKRGSRALSSAERYIELALLVKPIHAAESCSIQVKKPNCSIEWRRRATFPGSAQETVKACPFIGFGLERFCPGALGCQRWSSGPQCFRAEGPCLMAAFRILQTTGN